MAGYSTKALKVDESCKHSFPDLKCTYGQKIDLGGQFSLHTPRLELDSSVSYIQS